MPDFQKQTVQWFPGHMAKTRRKIKESLPLVDAVVEIVDARIPESSRNPELDDITSGKPRIILLNKSDVADQNATRAWMDHFQSRGAFVLSVDCKTGKDAVISLKGRHDPAIIRRICIVVTSLVAIVLCDALTSAKGTDYLR